MKNKFLEYIKIYNEVIDPKLYRDTQIARVESFKDIENFDIAKITFLGDFLENILNILKTFPHDKDLLAKGNNLTEPEDRFIKDRMETTTRGSFEDEDNIDDEEDPDYEDEDDVYDYDDEDEEDEDDDENYDEAYQPYELKAREHEYFSINDSDTAFFDRAREMIEAIKNKNFENNTIVNSIHDSDFRNLLKNKNYNDKFYKILYCAILKFLSKNNYFKRLMIIKGNGYLWIRSNIKDIIFTPVSRGVLAEINKKSIQISTLKTLVPDYEKLIGKDIIKKLDSLNKEKKDNIQEIIDTIDRYGKAFYTQQELTLAESRTAVLNLFKRLKTRFQNDPNLKKMITPIGLRKLIFDYTTTKPTSLTNEVLIDIKRAKELLLKLNYQFNDFEFESGRINKGDGLFTFKELIPILRQEMSEIKTFPQTKETERQRLVDELMLKTESVSPSFDKLLEEKIKNSDIEQSRELKDILNYDQKTDKKLNDLIKEGMSLKKAETNEIVKKYNRTKLNRLLTLTKEKNEISDNKQTVSREEYEELINILSNPHIIASDQKMKIIFTLSPRAFISQSTRANMANNIKSCMNLFYGANRKFIPTSIMDGAFTAWLVKVNKNNKGEDIVDSKIIDPIARVVMKPFRDNDNNIIWIPDKSYSSDKRFENLDDKVFQIIKYQMEDSPEGLYKLNSAANYRDTISQFKNNTFHKTINNQELLQQVIDKMPSELIDQFVTQAMYSTSHEAFFDKLNDLKLKKEVNLNRLGLFSPTSAKEISNKLNIKELTLASESIKRIADDVKIESLHLTYQSELKNINNLKYLKDIKKINIINDGFVFPDRLNKSMSLNELRLDDTNFKNMPEIVFPNAEVTLERCKNLPEKITCHSLDISDCSLSKTKQINAKELTLSKTVDKKSAKEISDFINMYEKLYQNPIAVLFFVKFINIIQSESSDSSDHPSGLLFYEENVNNVLDAYDSKKRGMAWIKTRKGNSSVDALIEDFYLKLNDEERKNIRQLALHPFLFYFIKGNIENLFRIDFKFEIDKTKSNDNAAYSDLEQLLYVTHASKDIHSKDIAEIIKSGEPKKFFNYLKNYKLNIVENNLFDNAESLTINVNYYKELDLRKNKKLKKLKIYNCYQTKIFLPPQIEEVILRSTPLDNIVNINELKNLKILSIPYTEKEPMISEEILSNLVKITFNTESPFFMKYLHNYQIYEMAVEQLNGRSMRLTSKFEIKERHEVFEKNIEKYIEKQKLTEKFENLNFIKIQTEQILDNMSLGKILYNLDKRTFTFLNMNFKKKDDVKRLQDKILLLDYKSRFDNEHSITINIKNESDNFYNFYLDVTENFVYNDIYGRNIVINIIDESDAVININRLIEKIRKKCNATFDISIVTKKPNRKILCDYYYNITVTSNNSRVEGQKILGEETTINFYLKLNDIEKGELNLDDFFKIEDKKAYLTITMMPENVIKEIKEKYFKNFKDKRLSEEMRKTVEIKMMSILKNFKVTHTELGNRTNIFNLNYNIYIYESIDEIINIALYKKIMNKNYHDYDEEDFNKEIEKLVKA